MSLSNLFRSVRVTQVEPFEPVTHGPCLNYDYDYDYGYGYDDVMYYNESSDAMETYWQLHLRRVGL